MNNYDINVLVNGNKCRQYLHKGRTYIEAKEGSEYVVEIKNNSWEKILAVVSVDGLNVVDGKTADENGAGYVMDKYTAQKLYGFQYSPEKVANFKFGAFGAVKIDPATGKPEIDPSTGKEIPLGYAASKGDGSEKNAGVIGVRIWDEVPKPYVPPKPNPEPVYTIYSTNTYSISASWCSGSCLPGYCGTGSYAVSSSYAINSFQITGGMYSPNPSNWNAGGVGYGIASTTNANMNIYPGNNQSDLLKQAIADAKAVRATALAHPTSAPNSAFQSPGVSVREVDNSIMYCSTTTGVDAPDMASFDMETQWGASRSYKVKEIDFERREVVHRFDLYYASRESLVAMGVDLGTERRVSFPESFKESKYAKPPKGWKA